MRTKLHSALGMAGRKLRYEVGADNADWLVDAVDLNAATAGAVLTLAADGSSQGFVMVPDMSVVMTLSDASGTSLAATVEIVGITHHGVPTTESISTTGDGAVSTTNAWRRIDSVTLTALANKAASDTLDIGLVTGGSSGARTRFGLPQEFGDEIGSLQFCRALASGAGVNYAITVDEATQTFECPEANGNAAVYILMSSVFNDPRFD
jgi:hypothetical protein